MKARSLVAFLVVTTTTAHAAPRFALDPARPSGPRTASPCGAGPIRCFAHVVVDEHGTVQSSAAPTAYGPAEIQAAYQIDPHAAHPATVAIVDAYGYPNLEADLAMYRATFGLPPCTQASGCLKIVNQNGQTSPLPAQAPPSDDWTGETALDVDMVSAACPTCKILVVQSNAPDVSLYMAHAAALAANPTVVSDSWGGVEPSAAAQLEPIFNHPGIAQFVSSGDDGWNMGGQGPQYPSTSAYVIAVGGTSLYQDSNKRGWSEVAWAGAGSSCSAVIPKPAYQHDSACSKRSAADISAVADPQTGVAVYNAGLGGWMIVGGTSAAAPITASIFAASGHGNATAADVANAASSVLFDVTSGSNGTCGNALCDAGAGWDGPTGFGTPSAAAIAGGMSTGGGGGGGGGGLAIAIASPLDGATVPENFPIVATASGAAVVGAFVDNVLIGKATAAPYNFPTPHMGPGPHVVTVVALDASNAQAQMQITVNVSEPPPTGETGGMGGCSAGGSPGLGLAFALVAFARRVRRGRTRRCTIACETDRGGSSCVRAGRSGERSIMGRFVIAIAFVAACGSDGLTPQEECDDTSSSLCERVYACYQPGELATAGYPSSEAACVTMLQASRGCAAQTVHNVCTGGNQTYHAAKASECADQITNLTCAEVRDPFFDVQTAAPACAQVCAVD